VSRFPRLFFIFEGNEHWVARDNLKSEGRNELGGRGGHHAVNFVTVFNKLGGNASSFVSGDGARDTEDNSGHGFGVGDIGNLHEREALSKLQGGACSKS